MATFGRQALPMVWDYTETNPLAGAGGDLYGTVNSVAEVIDNFPEGLPGVVSQIDARSTVTFESGIFSTDPPYYDNIGYAALSDFFYVWLRRSLSQIFPTILSTVLTPKQQELIASQYRHEGDSDRAKQFFEEGLGQAFTQMHKHQQPDVPLTIYYAFRQSEDDAEEGKSVTTASTGWETMLSAVIAAGFTVDGTWPIRTEQPKGLRAFEVNALASSIILSCRSRPANAPLATRRDFLAALKRELPDALKHLQQGNIAPVDLAQAAIGPGMAVFTRYAKVMEASGEQMKVRQALALINQTLDEVLAEQEGEFDADTRWALAWFEQFGMEEGAFGVAETLSKAKNTAINALEEAGILKTKGLKGKVRLLRRDELRDDWDPATDNRLRHWEVVQHLIRTLETDGETVAADLLRRLGGMADMARDLAYRLYSLCERNKWASEALAYNSLVIAWPELSKLALASRNQQPVTSQSELFN